MDIPLEQVDVAQLRSHVDRIAPMLRSERDLAQIRVIATNLAESVYAIKLTALLQDLPQPGALAQHYGLGNRSTARPHDLDTRIEQLIEGCYAALNEIEQFQRKVAQNQILARPQVRTLVLRRIVEREGEGEVDQWSGPLAVDLGLAEAQLRDALQYLERQGAIEPGGSQGYLDGGWSWLIRVTPHGRDLADGLESTEPSISFPALHVQGSVNVGVIGNVASGSSVSATQDNRVKSHCAELTQQLAIIRGLANDVPSEESSEIEEHVLAVEEELRSASPRASRIRSSLAAVGRIVRPLADWTGKAAIEAAVSAAIKSLTGGL